MNLTLPPLALVNDDLSRHTDDLPQVLPRFFIPRLQEKPQDPIMDTLRIELESQAGASQPKPPPGLMNMAEVNVQECSQGSPEEEGALFWERAAKKEVPVQVSYTRYCSDKSIQIMLRIKSGHGIHYDRHSLELFRPVPFYLNSQVAPLLRLATSM
jgi:hypothetical protein